MKRSVVDRTNLFTAMAGIVLALSGVAYAGSGAAAAVSNTAPKAKKGFLKISATADVGGVTLEPGEYEVKQVKSAAGPVVRFTRYIFNPYAQEGLPVHEWETVGEVRVTMQPLASRATHTELRFASDGSKAIALQIRGNSFDYLF